MRATTSFDGRNAGKKANVVLWVILALLAALFLFAGGMKLAMPSAALAAQSPLPVAFLRFIGVAEVCGALGLILPGLLRIRTLLTPLAAAGLVLVMIGATVVTIGPYGVRPALFPFAVGVLAALVAVGRRRWAPLRSRGAARVVTGELGRASL